MHSFLGVISTYSLFNVQNQKTQLYKFLLDLFIVGFLFFFDIFLSCNNCKKDVKYNKYLEKLKNNVLKKHENVLKM